MKQPNRLINEKSPYLLQHAYNPVDWYPWGEEAFEKASIEDKPIFLSIGYSTCHWCHVMENESFEDEEVAKLMNDAFVSIKVDREERPDIDGVYMSVCQMITGGGGWPLTIVMTPDKKPFFTGTYFPKYNRFNRIGMMELIPRLKEIWLNRRDEVIKSAEEISSSLKNINFGLSPAEIDDAILDKAYDDLNKRYDSDNGGFGTSPKFPSPHNLMFLLRYWKRNDNAKALEIVEKTLTQMRLGGIYDQIGFGFARYSTDKHWLVPHFEKMLYDQAMLIMAYTETYQITKNEFYKKTAEEIIEYVLRDMTHPDGGFYSAEDADSEGEEGKFYLWHADEIRNVLDKEESDLAIRIFNVSEYGNWVDESKGVMYGTNILHLKMTYEDLASNLNSDINELLKKIGRIREKLFNYREKRIHPHKDDKILTDWNALMISALAKAYQAFNSEKYMVAAEKAYGFIKQYLTKSDGTLFHRYREGDSGLPAHIDDYAFIMNALIDLYESTFNPEYLNRAFDLNDILIKEFWDETDGGFFFTSQKSEKLIARQKEIYDGAIPSGNSISLLNLLRLFKLTGKSEFSDYAERLISYFSYSINRSPSIFTQFLSGLDFYFGPTTEIVLSSYEFNDQINRALEIIRKDFNPNKVVVFNPANADYNLLKSISYLENMKPIGNKSTFYVCKNFICNQPVTDIESLVKILNE